MEAEDESQNFIDEDDEDGIDPELVDAIIAEMERVWGEPGLGGSVEEYEWLEKNYGITEGDDVHWQFVLQYFVTHDLPDEDLADEEVMSFLDDYPAVRWFLGDLLKKYKSADKVYPRE